MSRNRSNQHKLLSHILFFTLLGLLAGCSKPIVNVPLTPMPNLFHFVDKNCVAPCWKGIIPGTTDSATAVSIVSAVGHQPFVVQGSASIEVDSKVYNYEGSYFRLNNGDNFDLAFRDGVVSRIQIHMYENKPTLDEIVQVFGRPDSVCAIDVSVPDTEPSYETHIVYRDRGIWLSSYDTLIRTGDGRATITPGMEISQVTLFTPGDDLRLVMVQFSYPVHVLGLVIDCLRKWKDYGSYEYFYY